MVALCELENGSELSIADIRLFTVVLYEHGNRSAYFRLRDSKGMIISSEAERVDLSATDSERVFRLLQESGYLPEWMPFNNFIKWEVKSLDGERVYAYEGVE